VTSQGSRVSVFTGLVAISGLLPVTQQGLGPYKDWRDLAWCMTGASIYTRVRKIVSSDY